MVNKYGGNMVKVAIVLIAIFAFINTYLFVYPSLSYSLLTGICIAIMAVMVAIYIFPQKQTYNKMLYSFCTIWIVFILLYHYCKEYSDIYRVLYFIGSLLFAQVIALAINLGLIRWRKVENGILLVSLLNILWAYLQGIGCIKPENPYFKMTGLYENPSSTAIFICGTCAILFERVSQETKKMLNICLLLASLVTIILLQCRTAWIGLAVIVVVYIIKWQRDKKCTKRNIRLCQFCVFSVMALLCLFSYYVKFDSSQGRKLIWKNSLALIVNKPQGYGFGLFEKEYNNKQSDYFCKGNETEAEAKVADFVSMPYNDYIETAIEGGILGLAFYGCLYIFLIRYSYALKQYSIFASSLAFCVMATMNFIYTTVGVWLLIMSMFGYIMSMKPPLTTKYAEHDRLHKYNCVFVVLIGLFLGIKEIKLMFSQIQLTPIHKILQEEKSVKDESLEILECSIGTSEVYYTDMGKNYILNKNYKLAIRSLQTAQKYSASPTTYYLLWLAYLKERQYVDAIHVMTKLEDMRPTRLRPKYCMLQTYIAIDNQKKALLYANKILNSKLKVSTKEAQSIRRAALYFKLNNKIK